MQNENVLNLNSRIIKKTNPIGVFDSGMGGLTVLKSLKKTLPNESFVYLGDTARLPYGTKSVDTVRKYALQMARVLVEQQVKALVIACNTATTAALEHLKVILPDVPVMGVIEPGAQTAVEMTKNNKIAVLATQTTIKSSAYQTEIYKRLPVAKISTRACSVLVALAEEGMVNNKVAKEALAHYLEEFNDEDTILLGCTHFPVFKEAISDLVHRHVNIVDSAQCAAKALYTLLNQHDLLALHPTISASSKASITTTSIVNGGGNDLAMANNEKHLSPKSISNSNSKVRYLVTDSIERFQEVGEIFLGESLSASDIELIDINVNV